MTNRGFTTAERLHHVILEARSTHSPTCPQCGKQARTDRLTRWAGCVGWRCRPCGWEGEPLATLNTEGVMVRADAQGHATGEVL